MLTFIALSATLLLLILFVNFILGDVEMATQKKRVTISLSDDRYAEFEKLVKDSGLTKSTLVTSWILKEIQNQERKA